MEHKKKQKKQQDLLWALGPEPTYQKIQSEYRTELDKVKTDERILLAEKKKKQIRRLFWAK